MNNVKLTRRGNILTVEIDLSKSFGPSSTGRTIIVASTHGNVDVPDMPGAKIGVNAFKYPERSSDNA